ncbi:secreted repeat protein with Y-X4-D motif [Arcticibacter tournemirensis]|uniref:Secreted repeat protein with Y-X4-D motif n=1 Tax=Arcticibacter tournemirensis TaxID=699437 RepID=A0A4Q0MAC1_9SPHI|nr:hypothetical protein [Arcticibacter tournemirensis]KAA8479734.1 hypothetical protein F1649_16515 [Arcticibacter tournemirensis]RXF70200.1 hypothetical protein EKH83_10010 [Arcticibacter tournemirensis]TQM50237.1 secreted repeat protein with Y-X4-D motif [Arcticibacter tournemirensis]
MELKKLCYLLTVGALILTGSSCSKDDDDNGDNTSTVTGVQLSSNATFGNIITDNTGQALYFFSNDATGSSSCTDGCLVVWPVFYKDNLSIGAGLNASDFGTITRADGSKQTTYKGWPLYYYQSDTKAGEVKGDGVGNNWFVAKADYTVMVSYTQLVGDDGVQYNSSGQAGVGISQYLTDPNGNTLYAFKNDRFKQNKYSNNDPVHDGVWPVYAINSIGSIPSILDKTQFDVITVFGKTQLVYKGWPLYYFGPDNMQRGKTLGISVPVPGAAIWPIVNTSTAVAASM